MHVLCIGAHPDDNEFCVGGTAALMRRCGDTVRFVSVTNGDKGHYTNVYRSDPSRLAARRLVEARTAAGVIGADYQTLGIHDGEVYVDQPSTEAMVRCIRSFGETGKGPDLVLLNRPVDYHRDHRYAAQLVLDATYMLTVPLMCPDVRHLDRMPVFAYWYDDFRDIIPFRADIAVGIDGVMEQKIDMLCAHVSQVFEWLPYNAGRLSEIPPESDAAGRRAGVAQWVRGRSENVAKQCAAAVTKWVGPEGATYAEAFQLCEYGRKPNEEDLKLLFPIAH